MARFSNGYSRYKKATDDPRAVVLNCFTSPKIGDKIDITEILQSTIAHLHNWDNCGIVFLPEGDYAITKTIYFPRGIRLYGFGEKRPTITLLQNTPGFDKGDSPFRDDMKYMIWFTDNAPTSNDDIRDSNPGTFYTGISNINFKIEDGNPCAVVMRAHFAQTSFVSFCEFDIGNGKAGIHEVGNEMEHLSFKGGDYGIYTGKCSPGWPFALTDTDFDGQRISNICCHESGFTSRRVSFSNSPIAIGSEQGKWDKQVLIDCTMKNIGTALEIPLENNTNTQYNMTNVLCENVSLFAKLNGIKKTGTIATTSNNYIVKSFTHGYVSTFGEDEKHKVSDLILSDKDIESFEISEKPAIMPEQETWINIKTFGALGDGKTDDTKAILEAAKSDKTIYFPQGYYIVTDTISLSKNTNFIGLNPISTSIILPDDSENFARLGSPKAVLETPQDGTNYVSGFAIDANARNPRAVAIKWQSGVESYLYDIKILGGHGGLTRDARFLPPYNKTRTADFDHERRWDSQYPSIWVTNGGGGIFKNIWTASPYASAGLLISDTETYGAIYQISSEHHVRHEIIMRNVKNWNFFAVQTEEEVAEGSYCQPFELSDCENILFSNFYAFRVIWVDNPYPSVMKTWNCKNIEIQNVHNFTQMKYTIDSIVLDAPSGVKSGFWQLAKLTIKDSSAKTELPSKGDEVKMLFSGFDYIDSMAKDSNGNIYICDSRLNYIYKYTKETGTFHFVTRLHYRPLSLAFDNNDNLLVVTEYKPVSRSKNEDGVDELSVADFGDRSYGDLGACYYVFFRYNRRVRVYSMNPTIGEDSISEIKPQKRDGLKLETLYYASNQWRDNHDFLKIVDIKDENCYVAPDGVTAITHSPSIARSCNLVPAKRNGEVYLTDEYTKVTVKLSVNDNLDIVNPEVVYELGEYSSVKLPDGSLFISDCNLYKVNGEEETSYKLSARPASLLYDEDEKVLYISARDKMFALKL